MSEMDTREERAGIPANMAEMETRYVARAEAVAATLAAFSDDVLDAHATQDESEWGSDTVVVVTLTVGQAEQLAKEWSR